MPVAKIANFAFQNHTNITSVTISGSVTNIGLRPFTLCPNLTALNVAPQNAFYSSVNGVLLDKSQTALLAYPCGLGGGYTISNGITSIGDSAFYSCALTSVTISGSVTNFGPRPFGDCTNLTAITVAPQNSFYVSVDSVLFNQGQTTLIEFPGGRGGTYTITNLVAHIADFAFNNCPNLAGVTIPSSVTNLGIYAFQFCTSLASVAIPGSVTSVGLGAFGNCASLTNATIAQGVAILGDYSFQYCSSLTNAMVPGSVNRIGYAAFS